jgi:hypothetical protein
MRAAGEKSVTRPPLELCWDVIEGHAPERGGGLVGRPREASGLEISGRETG